jgi:hypothetical protein
VRDVAPDVALKPTQEIKRLGFHHAPSDHIWLPFLDTYRTMCLAPQQEFLLLLEQAADLPIAA